MAAILKKLAGDDSLAAQASEHGFVKYVTELSLEELMAANLSGAQTAFPGDASYSVAVPTAGRGICGTWGGGPQQALRSVAASPGKQMLQGHSTHALSQVILLRVSLCK